MIAPGETEREPLWQRVLLVVAPAIATAVVVEAGITMRAWLDRRREAPEAKKDS